MGVFTSQELLGSLAVALGLFGYIFYVRGILQGKVKPHAFTWFVWGLLTAIAFIAQIVEGGGAGSWITGVTALCSFGFAIVGLGKSSRTFIAKSDWVFFIAALFTIPIWYFTGNPLWSVIIITITDAVAFAPTFRKAFSHPKRIRVIRSKIRYQLVCTRKFYLDNCPLPCLTCAGKLRFCRHAFLEKTS